MKLTTKELENLIREEVKKIKQQIAENVVKTEEPFDVKLNKNDKSTSSNKALVYKDKSKKTEKSGTTPVEVKMNQSKDTGNNEKIATAVAVKAGSKKGGSSVTAGQANANFTSKKDNPKTSVSAPFDDKVDVKMNKEDKVVGKDAKTFVEAGAKKGGNTVTAGQAKAIVKEKAPKSGPEKPIATGIEINAGNTKKESYTKATFAQLIREEALKLIKKEQLQEELNKINEELKKIN